MKKYIYTKDSTALNVVVNLRYLYAVKPHVRIVFAYM